ncbi:MAG: aminodeoxychorismate/anthranilate synthase component II [Salibacteraceae bacterium]|jgi:anthranilate synthase component II|nr:aminodeoxychorismate/anthranilate synthase component II [Salibacteraceae bacterium]MDP4686414.1 aminodeoxychorismate/anthranilate synthase component II [Salibacteraceae bacterium]MDP4764630.1 aminodeoxychorismate/anthranilate synthase component II [Salibacteraceae bacterium]MDP4844656.1 aminodeoxychorismate/anthranilate synthase component II [Salibacteraceae bacterium]MDP4965994.1 aminodeoxychorismate/anthranilate synthase component II [Salibacteraceae bacterium]
MPTSIFVIDNYDSFTFNLVHLLEQLDVPIEVRRNDAFEIAELATFSHILISPGPGLPEEAGKTMQVIETYLGQKSMLGVCLGMQALLQHAGAQIQNMKTVQHGAQSQISVQSDSKLFKGLPDIINVGRYHSWAFETDALPSNYREISRSEDGYLMAVQHKELDVHGVQFHPESIMTEFGLEMMKNWVGS